MKRGWTGSAQAQQARRRVAWGLPWTKVSACYTCIFCFADDDYRTLSFYPFYHGHVRKNAKSRRCDTLSMKASVTGNMSIEPSRRNAWRRQKLLDRWTGYRWMAWAARTDGTTLDGVRFTRWSKSMPRRIKINCWRWRIKTTICKWRWWVDCNKCLDNGLKQVKQQERQDMKWLNVQWKVCCSILR